MSSNPHFGQFAFEFKDAQVFLNETMDRVDELTQGGYDETHKNELTRIRNAVYDVMVGEQQYGETSALINWKDIFDGCLSVHTNPIIAVILHELRVEGYTVTRLHNADIPRRHRFHIVDWSSS